MIHFVCPWVSSQLTNWSRELAQVDSRTSTFRVGSRRVLKSLDQRRLPNLRFLMREMLAGLSTLHLVLPQIACKFDVKRSPARTGKLFRLV